MIIQYGSNLSNVNPSPSLKRSHAEDITSHLRDMPISEPFLLHIAGRPPFPATPNRSLFTPPSVSIHQRRYLQPHRRYAPEQGNSPKPPPRFAGQVVILHLQMNSRKSCWIELNHTVCWHDPLAIFHRAEEYRGDAIADQIPGCTFLKKHICLIEQQDCVPVSHNLKDLEEPALEPTYIGG